MSQILCLPGVLTLAALGSFGSRSLHAQQAISVNGACGIERTEMYGVVRPVYPAAAANPGIANYLKVGYEQFYGHENESAAAESANQALSAAMLVQDTCARALATYLLSAATDQTTDEATALNQSAIDLFGAAKAPHGLAYAELHLANLLARHSKFADAMAHYQAADRDFKAINDPYGSLLVRISSVTAQRSPDYASLDAEAAALKAPCLRGTLHDTWSYFAGRASRLDDAMLHGNLAETYLSQCKGAEGIRAGNQTNLGRLERQQGRPLVALEHYRVALRLQLQSNDHSLVPQTYNAMGVAYENMKDYTHAFPMYLKGLAIARELHSQPLIDFLETNLGTSYARAGQPKLAIPLLLRTTKDLPNDHLRCARLVQLGIAYRDNHTPELAVAPLASGIAACRTVGETDRLEAGLETAGDVELRLHHYERALTFAREEIRLVESTRSHVVAQDAYKQGFLNENLITYNTAIAALTALNLPAEALEVAEQARARAFLDLLASHPVGSKAAPAPHSLDQYRKDLIDSPAQTAPLTIDQMMQATTRLHSTLLAYWLSNDTLYLWVARPGEPVAEATQPITPARLAALVAATRRPVIGSTPNPWRTLYGLLIAPVEQHLPATDGDLLTIVPSGPLFALSFAALQAPDGHYLAEQLRSHTIPTVGLLPFTQHNAEASASLSAHTLFIANPEHLPKGPEGRPLSPLPGTALEVDAIAHLLPAVQFTRLDGAAANATELRAKLPTATILHLATHAVVNDADPYASFLALDDSARDGKLTVADIYALRLSTRLVVLSACSTGLGKVTGDGVAGMSRAFFYAGSASVLNTLWDIADSPTAALLPRFYSALNEGQPPSTALRTAQLSMLSDLRHHRLHSRSLSGQTTLPASPAYWAAFTLAGEP